MKLSTCSVLALVAHSASAFAPSATATASTTALHLFGGGGDKDGEKKGPGMMDQLAMFKKAQEIATKKKKIDEDLKAQTYEGESEGGKVKGTFKYVPVANPMDPNPEYEAVGFEFDDDFFESASPEDLSAACKETISNAIGAINLAVAKAYQPLNEDLMGVMGGAVKKEE